MQRVRQSVSQNRVHAGPRRQDLEAGDASGSGIAAMRRDDGAANLGCGTPDESKPGH